MQVSSSTVSSPAGVSRPPPGPFKAGFGFVFEDLYRPDRLADLTRRFDAYLSERDPAAASALMAYRAALGQLPPVQVSNALTGAAPYLSAFVAELFGVQAEREAALAGARADAAVLQFKKEVVKKRLAKRFADPGALDDVRAAFHALLHHLGLLDGAHDDERAAITVLLPAFQSLDRVMKSLQKGGEAVTQADLDFAERAVTHLAHQRIAFQERADEGKAERAERILLAYLAAAEQFLARWVRDHEAVHGHGGHPHPWTSLRQVRKLDFENLVQLKRPRADLPELAVGPASHLRDRDGFALTDPRFSDREVLGEVDYCIYCHARDKDSCSKGFVDKVSGAFKPNPLGVPLAGCPLEEKIGEAHQLRGVGDSIGALAIITVDNPMCPGTGHRICNDCMKACIYQKQDPVNIPQVETNALVNVLDMPWGFEIYGLLTRWNPLHPTRQHPRPYNNRNVLVVGLGPAGYTLAQHLLREGFGVVAIDGLKIEPLPEKLVGRHGAGFLPIHDWREFYSPLENRPMLGFGGVSEYGITIRWDKNFLTVIAATLLRWRTLHVYGGIRFGGTFDLEDAWQLGFDHVAICAGAGKPTLVDVPNGMIRGIRQASDFLMALQLTGAHRKDALNNLQVRLPAVVIGGGLTAIDTATELIAYYVVQCEKSLDRWNTIVSEIGEEKALASFDPEERGILLEQVAHGREIREERRQARLDGRAPSFHALIAKWGGVTLAYRRSIKESPAYRLNHEEIAKSLEEGIAYAEHLSPKEAIADQFGAVASMKFERMKQVDGKLVSTGEIVELPARTVCVAAGTAPNTTIEKEYPGLFVVEKKTKAFLPHRIEMDENGSLSAIPDPAGFFTSYVNGHRTVSYYGDNLPAYAGSVVRAMASAKDGYAHVAKLFTRDPQQVTTDEQSHRNARWETFEKKLDDELLAEVAEVRRLTPTITEVIVRAPLAAKKFLPGQFYRLQNFEADSPRVGGTVLMTEGLALTGAWSDPAHGLLSMIILEMGVSSRLVAMLKPGQRVVVMGPTGAPTEIPKDEHVLLAGGGLGNAVLFSIGRALRANGCKVVYFAGYRNPSDVFRRDDVEASADQVIWACDRAPAIEPRRPQDRSFVGNIVQAMVAYAEGRLGEKDLDLSQVERLIVIGSDRMMNAVRQARHAILKPYLKPGHVAIGSINSPMQCMMKEICAQCLQRHVDPVTGAQKGYVFTCFNQDQCLDEVDFENLNGRLKQASVQEKLSNLYLDHLFRLSHVPRV